MKKIVTSFVLLLSVIAVAAQNWESRVGKPGFHYEAGVGVSYSGFGNYVDLSPEAGVLYRIGAKDAFGLTVQGRLPTCPGTPIKW